MEGAYVRDEMAQLLSVMPQVLEQVWWGSVMLVETVYEGFTAKEVWVNGCARGGLVRGCVIKLGNGGECCNRCRGGGRHAAVCLSLFQRRCFNSIPDVAVQGKSSGGAWGAKYTKRWPNIPVNVAVKGIIFIVKIVHCCCCICSAFGLRV